MQTFMFWVETWFSVWIEEKKWGGKKMRVEGIVER